MRHPMLKPAAIVLMCTLGWAGLSAQQPRATDLSGKPLFIKKTWTIGGEGNWDYLTLDPIALQLFVAHGTSVQVVDVNAGALVGQVTGMRDAHGIALDDSGALGFVSDGPADRVRIFDRHSLQVVASVPTGPNPRAIVYEPLTRLVFAICTQPLDSTGDQTNQTVRSVITVIDVDKRAPLADLLLPGKLGFGQADGRGEVYVNIVDRNRIAHFDAQSLLAQVHQFHAPPRTENRPPPSAPVIDWSGGRTPGQQADGQLHTFRLGAECRDPKGLAVDGNHLRLFAACDNQRMQVLNTGTGEVIATLTIGPGTDAIGYDASRGLIYTSNGGGLGSLTVIRQSVTDTYAVVQELPTRQRARTLAVNPTNGEVYLVTNLMGFDMNKKGTGGGTHTLPVVQASAVAGSFQVVVVGN